MRLRDFAVSLFTILLPVASRYIGYLCSVLLLPRISQDRRLQVREQ